MNRDCDDAVSAVIAMMLILAILSTCIAVYSATYVPGLRQQSEILHTEDVSYSFQRFSSDVDSVYMLAKPAQFSTAVMLGGGNILLSPAKSSGTLEMTQHQIGSVSIGGIPTPVYMTTVSYTPSYSSWELQGYRYENGVVWITKGANMTTEKKTPMDALSIRDGFDQENETVQNFLRRMADTIRWDGDNATLTIITMEPSGKTTVTGSGMAKLKLNASFVEEKIYPLSSGGEVVFSDLSGRSVAVLRSPSPTNLTVKTLLAGVSVS